MTTPRVGIVGARRVRQGLGPFVAAYLRDAGADVCCFAGTTSESVAAAGRELAERSGIEARGYTDADEMLAREDLGALAILSPAETHRGWLERALDAGLHVLCEKPFLWGADDDAARTAQLVSAFTERGLTLIENCQWPYTVPAYRALHPDDGEPLRSFAMRLSPVSAGPTALGDSLPHAFSLLQALCDHPEARVENITFVSGRASDEDPGHAFVGNETRDPALARLVVGFDYVAGETRVRAEVALVQSDSVPRAAGWGVNDRWAQRLVRTADYAQFFSDGGRVVDVPDPLPLLLADFVDALRARRANCLIETRKIVQRMEFLDRLCRAFSESGA